MRTSAVVCFTGQCRVYEWYEARTHAGWPARAGVATAKRLAMIFQGGLLADAPGEPRLRAGTPVRGSG